MIVKPFIVLAASLFFSASVHAATFTVVNTNSNGAGSLDQAITDANGSAGSDVITFAITNLSFTIRPSAALPTITEPVTIDGRSQTGFVGAPIVEISGGSAGAAVDGLKIATSNSVISALVINGFLGDGIEITNGANNIVEGCYIGLNRTGATDAGNTLNGVLITNSPASIIGGLGATNRNFISGNNQSGIAIGGATSLSNSILGNVIGLNVTNNAVVNSVDGIRVNAPFTVIGGSTSPTRNIISGNTGDGIESVAPLGTNMIVRGNWIGVDTNGVLDRGNSANGILAAAGAAVIGGSGAGDGNLITGNNGDGIQLTSVSSTNHLVLGNVIGSTSAFAAGVINSGNGILITTSSRSNVIGGILAGEANTIYFNGGDGIAVAAANANTNNAFRGNLIFGNTASGIDLGAAGITANDNGDADVGANQLQNFPVLTSVSNTATTVFITGTLNSRPSTTYAIDFYSSIEADTVLNGEGQFYIGSTNLTTAADSNLAFTVSIPLVLQGRHVSATATDPSGNTSEFSVAAASVSFASAQTFTVVNTNDSGAGSLREAINQANLAATTGSDTIQFAITNLSTTISPSSELPAITDPVTIDGYTQPGAAVNTSATIFNGTVLVRIAGASAGSGANGITITASNCVVRGLMITGFVSTGADGIEILGGGNNLIEGCLLGIDSSGTDQGNGANGVFISGSPNNVIGGTTASARNVISGNQSDGVEINGAGATGNQVLGNLIGTGLTGVGSIPNSADGVLVTGAGANVIGSSAAGAGNLISGNSNDGIELTGAFTTNTTVLGNRIGTEVTGSTALANAVHGVNVNTSSRSNLIGGVIAGQPNVIAFNGQDGINVAAATANTNNTFRGNSIFSNGSVSGELGIDLGAAGVQANDLGDADTGANQLQNFPVLAWVTNTPGGTVFSGSFNSRPSLTYTIDFYANTDVDTDGAGEGKYYLGSTNLTTAADSNVTFTVSLPVVALPGRYVSATATDPFGNTSEFATNVFAQSTVIGTTFTVVNTNDSGAGSLRQAIIDANANISAGDTIAFAITNLSTTISPASALPTIIDPVTIDGYTQPGAAVNTSATIFNGAVLVRIAGASAGSGANGLTITAGNSTVRGLMITGFTGTTGDGIEISGAGGNLIEGCLLGIDGAGTDQGNAGNGVFISSSANNLVGGTTPASRNVISGNNSDGVEINGAGATDNQVLGNLIGTGLTGVGSVPNSADGVLVTGAGANLIGSLAAGAGNLISGNSNDGIELTGASTTNTTVLGNRIGTEVTGASALANAVHGVNINTSSRSNLIGGVIAGQANVIAFNGQDGINVAATVSNTNNTFRGNSIFSNGTTSGELGIDLGAAGVTANDAGDPDSGANQLQNFPILTSAANSPTETTFSGTLNSSPSTLYTIDFYANTASDTDGVGEGQFYLGSTNLSTSADSNVTFTISLPVISLPGRYVTATATDPFGNTSEFGTNVYASSTVPGLAFVVVHTNDSGAGSLRQAILNANVNISAGDTISFAITNLSTTISPASALPAISDPVTIDGYTQSGATQNNSATAFNGTLPVRIDGVSAGSGVDGLRFTISSNTVRGLIITRFSGDGIEIAGGGGNTISGNIIGLDAAGADLGNTANGVLLTGSSNNVIGGAAPGLRNVISGNSSDGVEITGAGAFANLVLGNILGTDMTGTTNRGNGGNGVLVTSAADTVIGGTTTAARNLISANTHGISLATASGTIIRGNYIGTDVTGSLDLGNSGDGINASSSTNSIIGGVLAGAGNLISGNNSDGIEFAGVGSSNNIVHGNFIGTTSGGTTALANSINGVNFTTNPRANRIGGTGAGEPNIIAFNLGDGISVATGTNNTLRGNSIYSNGNAANDIGIDLGTTGVTANDVGDVDTGANQLQNFPVLTSASNSLTGTIISGSLNSAASASFEIDFYSSYAPDVSGSGQGQTYLGSTNVTTDGGGNVAFTAVLAVTNLMGRHISATATDANGNTSEFATNVFAVSSVPGYTYVVVNTNDAGAGSLREAILSANVTITEDDRIEFNIPGAGPHVIAPSSALPVITDPVVIDGYSQPGASANTLPGGSDAVWKIVLDGANAGSSVNGLHLSTGGNTARGLVIIRFQSAGIQVNGNNNEIQGNLIGLDIAGNDQGNFGAGVNVIGGTNNLIGGSTPAERNVISGNNGTGVNITGTATARNFVKGNFIGTDSQGTNNLANGANGIGLTSSANTIGGLTAGERNLISANNAGGIVISGVDARTNVVIGNYIGTDVTGTRGVGQQFLYGVYVPNSSYNTIGGTAEGAGNLISGNSGYGVQLAGTTCTNNVVAGNLIGTDFTGTLPVPNISGDGVRITDGRGNLIGGAVGNTIAFNGLDGVAVVSGLANSIRSNRIFSNVGLGIDLGTSGVTANDLNDADTGANQLQNFPVLSGATNSITGVTIGGSLDSAASTIYAIDFFANSTNDLSGAGEGQFFLGSTNVTTDGAGHVDFVVSFPTLLAGRFVTATATDPLGNTSEFGTNVFATSTVPGLTLVVTNTANSGAGSLREAITQANAAITTGDTITFNIPGAGVQVISPTSALPPITDPLTINGYSQPGASANTLTNGHNAVLRVRLDGASAGVAVDGLLIATRDSLVRGLAIGGFSGDGIEINNGLSNRVEGCYLGLDPDGTTRRGNTVNGVNIVSGSTGNIIGGETPASRCIISANNRGIVMTSVSFNAVKGSCIGTDAGGLLACGNTNSGVLITGSTARWNNLGGTNSGARNVISGNGLNFTSEGHGITLSQCLSNSILGNYIGTTAGGSAALGNQDNGISLQSGASTNFIGGGAPGAGNVISANNIGIDFSSFSPDQNGNFVQGNLIGTDATGLLDIGNIGLGISFSFADYNQVGGTGAGERNVISGNAGAGVNINCCAAASNRFEGNFVGVDITGTNALGNDGEGFFVGSPGNIIGGTVPSAGNIIANNGSDGVLHFISSHYGVAILANSIYSNSGLGIDLGLNSAPNPNDLGDTDEGANHFQNFPVIASALQYPTNTIITASLNSRSNTTYRVELFDNASSDTSGFGEGQTYLGFTNVTTDASGNVAFTFTNGASLPFGHYITATATDPTNNTSEFSAVRKVVPFDSVDLNLVIADSDDPASRSTNHFYTLYITNAGPANATSVFVTNTLPPELVYVNATTSQGSASHAAGVVTCDLGLISNGGFATVQLQVNATNTGSFVDQAVVVAVGQLDNETNNNSDAESTFFGIADVAVSITDSPDPVVAGQVLTNIVVVTNRGPDAATFVNGSFDLAFNAVPTSAGISQGSYIQSGNNFSFNPGTIPAGGAVTLTVAGIPTESGLISHFASASATEADFVSTNNNTSANTTVTDGSGVLQFFLATFNVTESSAQAFVFVKRTGGAIGNVAAGYSTSNGSAMAGLDYSNTVGTISFTNGETLKTFSVPIINDALFECNEYFNVSLHSPTGGVVLIVNTQSVVNLIENDLNPGGNVTAVSGSTNLLPGAAGNDDSFQSSVSAAGRYVTFSSYASNLSPDDDNFNQDVFVRDLLTQTTTLVSYDQGGSTSGNGSSQNAIISGSGRYVVFDSSANNLNFNDHNSNQDVFVRDLLTGVNTLVSLNAAGTNGGNNSSYSADSTRTLISSNGQWVAYTSYASDLDNTPKFNGIQDVFLFDRVAGTNRLISVNQTGTAAGNAESFDPVISADGQRIAFTSFASDLVSNDANANNDVFVRNFAAGVTELVSVNFAATGTGNGSSSSAYLNEDGRYVVFQSSSSNIATNDTNTRTDVFWRDRIAGVTLLVSVNTNNVAGNSFSTVRGISANGRYVVFSSTSYDLVPGDYNFAEDVFVRDMFSNVTLLVSKTFFGSDPGNGTSRNPVISGDGSHVAFESYATDLTPATKFGFYSDIFVRNLTNNTMRLVSFRNGDTNGPNGSSFDAAISFTGNVTAFTGDAENGGGGEGLVVGGGSGPMALGGSISFSDVWAHTYASNITELVSVSAPSMTGTGFSYDPQVSRDGQWVAFVSTSDNLVTNDVNVTDDVMVMNLASHVIELVSANSANGSGSDFSSNPSISTNGNYVAFESYANDLVTGDNNFARDVFVRDRVAGTNILASINLAGTGPGNGYSENPVISQDGRYIAFESGATDLTALSDTNFNTDVFLRDRVAGTTTLISRSVAGTSSGNGYSFNPVIEVDPVSGRVYVAYLSYADNLVNNDNNNSQDVFLFDVTAGSNYLVSINVAGNGSSDNHSYNPHLAVGPASSNVFVVFSSYSTNLVNNDTNFSEDLFIYKLSTGLNELVSVNQTGSGSGNSFSISPSISADGRYVAFSSGASDLVAGDTNSMEDVFLRDRQTGVTTLISMNCDGSGSGNDYSFNPVISANGRYVSYLSAATDLIPGNFTSFAQNVFRYDRQLGVTTLVSQNRNLTGGGNADSYDNQISANGATVAFSSDATDLVMTDANNNEDVFVWQAGAVTPLPDLVLDKTASTNTVSQSGSFSYTLAVTNFGSSVATSVSVIDNLPVGLTFVSAASTQGTVTNSGNIVSANIGSLAVNAGANITINVTALSAGSVSNFANASAFEADANPANNSDSAIVTVTPSTLPTLSIQPTNSTQLLITWPLSTPAGFLLESTTNLTPVIVWTSVTNSVSTSGTNKFVILNVDANEPERYYRLKQ